MILVGDPLCDCSLIDWLTKPMAIFVALRHERKRTGNEFPFFLLLVFSNNRMNGAKMKNSTQLCK